MLTQKIYDYLIKNRGIYFSPIFNIFNNIFLFHYCWFFNVLRKAKLNLFHGNDPCIYPLKLSWHQELWCQESNVKCTNSTFYIYACVKFIIAEQPKTVLTADFGSIFNDCVAGSLSFCACENYTSQVFFYSSLSILGNTLCE